MALGAIVLFNLCQWLCIHPFLFPTERLFGLGRDRITGQWPHLQGANANLTHFCQPCSWPGPQPWELGCRGGVLLGSMITLFGCTRHGTSAFSLCRHFLHSR